MPLEPSQQTQFLAWLESKHVNGGCPACGMSDQWMPGEIINPPTLSGGRILKDGTIQLGEKTKTMVQLVCNNCAYTMLFAAVPIGLVI